MLCKQEQSDVSHTHYCSDTTPRIGVPDAVVIVFPGGCQETKRMWGQGNWVDGREQNGTPPLSLSLSLYL